MVDYPFVTSYAVGNASVDAGGLTVTGQGTFWQDNANPELSPIRAGDLFGTHKGFAIRILEVVSATELTLAHPCPFDQDLTEYEIQLTPRIVGAQQATRLLQKQLSSGNLSAFAALEGQDNLLPIFTGAGTMELVTKQSLASGADYDVQVNNLEGRAVYDSRPANFRVFVSDIGDGRSAIYSKNSNTAADWSAPAIITGPPGPDGVNPRGDYDPATSYIADDLVYSGGSTWIAKVGTEGNAPPTLPTTENTQWRIFARAGSAGVNPRGAYAAGTTYVALDVVLDNGSSWIAKITTTGNAPPTLPATENAYWSLLAAKGADGAGAGDVVGPNGGVTAKQIAGFGSTTGKAIVGLTAAEARAASATPVGNFRNKIINPLFSINQRAVSGTVNLAAGAYGHDRMKAGPNGCTYAFSANNGVTTLNITAGSLQQVIEASSFAGEAGNYVLSWAGTAQGRINGGTYSASGAVTATIDGSANVTIEFTGGTVSVPGLEKDYVTPFSARHRQQEFALCQRYFQKTYQEDVAPGTTLSVPGMVEGRGDGGNYAVLGTFSFNVWMRAAPSITIYNYATGAVGTGRLASNNTDIPVASSLAGSRGVKIYVNNTQTPAVGADIQVHFTANSEI